MEILNFIFKSFWHFIGTLWLCSVIFGQVGRIGRSSVVNVSCKDCPYKPKDGA